MTTSVSKLRIRGMAWTLNNYEEEDIDRAKNYIQDQCLYGCFSQEVGEKGTKHLQGYVYFENPRFYPVQRFRKWFNNRVHDEIAYSSPNSNKNYVSGMCPKKGMKMNPTFWENGECPTQGSRTDYAKAIADLQTMEIHEVINDQPHLLPMINALTRYRQQYRKSTHRDVRVVCLIGKTRTNKSRSAWEAYPDLYSKPTGQYWGTYDGQETVLLDDFSGDIPITELLKILDRYPLDLPIKGSHTPAFYKNVIITSNLTPEQWYPYAHPDSMDALRARMRILNKTIYVKDDILEYTHGLQEEEHDKETQETRSSSVGISSPSVCAS